MTQLEENQKRKAARLRELNAIHRRFPQLPVFCGKIPSINDQIDMEIDAAEIEALFNTYVQIIPQFHQPAIEAQRRTSLSRLIVASKRVDIQESATRAIAESDIRSGIIHSTYVRKYPDLWQSVKELMEQHDAAYGASVFSRNWRRLSRGGSLNYYFSNHEKLLEGKRILHVAPEAETSKWFQSRAVALNMDYTTLNLGGDVDFLEDLTALDIPDQSFDWIICHRVLEHIFDDSGALKEAYRVLRPGGIFNVSVPESMHLPTSEEWLIPDLSHHHHYRQYGANFSDTLDGAGFETTTVSWILRRSPDELDGAGAYPLRMYNALRSQ